MNLYESNSCEVFCMWFTSMNSILQFSLSSGRESGVTTRCHGNMSCVLISFIICDLVKKKTIDARLIMGERRVGQSTRGCTQRNWGLAAFVAFMLYLVCVWNVQKVIQYWHSGNIPMQQQKRQTCVIRLYRNINILANEHENPSQFNV